MNTLRKRHPRSDANILVTNGFASSENDNDSVRRRLPRKWIWIVVISILSPVLSHWYILRHSTSLPLMPEDLYISSLFDSHPTWHPSKRSERFPSVEERVKLYMSNFYVPTCNSAYESKNGPSTSKSTEEKISFSYHFPPNSTYPEVNLSTSNNRTEILQLTTRIKPDTPIVLWEDTLDPCYFPVFDNNYCEDARKMAAVAKRITGKKTLGDLPPIIAFFGDDPFHGLQKQKVPFFKKFRDAASKDALEMVTTGDNWQGTRKKLKLTTLTSKCDESSNFTEKCDEELLYSPIIWPLNCARHFDKVSEVGSHDSPWESKKNQGVWRGQLTGTWRANIINASSFQPFEKLCDMVPRCRLVRDNIDSPVLDVGVSNQSSHFPTDKDHLHFIKGIMPLSDQMRYKVIIMIEGNDVSSGLKWALYSRSVVMMPPPTKSSFLMEELLIPWVHYIPLKHDLSDVSEQMNWVIENDQAARKIAERATLFLHDLLYHEDAEMENRQIQEEILCRYMTFFGPE